MKLTNVRIMVPAMFVVLDILKILTGQKDWVFVLSVFLLPFWTVMLVLGLQERAKKATTPDPSP